MIQNKKKINSILITAGLIVFALLTILSLVKAVFVSLDIDESYSLAVAYRMYLGDLPIRDMWEPHQFSGFFLLPFVALFNAIAGSAEGIVIAVRVVGIIIHLFIGALFVLSMRKEFHKALLFFVFLLHTAFLPKWVQIPEFELISYWMLLLMFVCFHNAFKTGVSNGKKYVLLTAAGFCLLCSMLCYPSMAILYPLFVAAVFVNEESKGKAFLSGLFFTLGAAVPGIILIVFFLSYMSIPEFILNLKHVKSDSSHSIPLAKRMLSHAKEMILPLLICVLTFVSSLIIRKTLKKEKAFSFGISTCIAGIVFATVGIIGCFFFRQGQFFLLWKYFPIAFGGFVCAGILSKKEKTAKSILWFLILPGFMAVFAILILTNMDVNTTMSKIFPSVIGTVLIIYSAINRQFDSAEANKILTDEGSGQIENKNIKEVPGSDADEKNNKRFATVISAGFMVALLVPILICRLYLVRVTGCVYFPITMRMEQIKNGPAKGIFMIPELADAMNENYDCLKDILTDDDKVLYISGETLYYLFSKAAVSGASTQGTTVFDNLFIAYLNEHENKYPTVVVVDKDLWVYPYYFVSEYNEIMLEWIQYWYPYTDVKETDHLIIYSLKPLSE